MPNPQLLHIDAALTTVAATHQTLNYGAPDILPVYLVDNESDVWYSWGDENISDDIRMERAAGTEAASMDYAAPSTTSFSLKEYALKKTVTYREMNNADAAIKPLIHTTNILNAKHMLRWERSTNTLCSSTSNFGATITATAAWDSGSNNMEKDCDDAKEAIEKNSGYVANTIVIPAPLARVMKRDTVIRNLLRYTDPTLLVNGDLPPVLWNMRVVIPGARLNSAAPGQTTTNSRVWTWATGGSNQKVQVLYVNPNPTGDDSGWGLTLRQRAYGLDGFAVEQYERRELKGVQVEYTCMQVEKLFDKYCGAVINGV